MASKKEREAPSLKIKKAKKDGKEKHGRSLARKPAGRFDGGPKIHWHKLFFGCILRALQ